jgi:catechol 2,3-dioxygenase-like lactoylglutathione lyase family enzyme
VIDHFGINCADYARSQQFYDRVLGALGYSRQLDFGEAIGYGRDGKPTSPPSSGIRTATMSKPSAMGRVGGYV